MAKSPTRGRFITLEGIEGAGKSTVAQLVSEWLASRGISARVTREPGGTPLAERVRKIVLDRGDEAVSPRAETLLMFAARSIHVENLIRPALGRGEWVLCDRFTDASRAYQGYGRGMDLAWIENLAQAVHGILHEMHDQLGEGVVTGTADGGQVIVRFRSDGSERRLLLAYAPLKRI